MLRSPPNHCCFFFFFFFFLKAVSTATSHHLITLPPQSHIILTACQLLLLPLPLSRQLSSCHRLCSLPSHAHLTIIHTHARIKPSTGRVNSLHGRIKSSFGTVLRLACCFLVSNRVLVTIETLGKQVQQRG
ncbi:hypothetical protein LZ31DRAFT_167855 [Colletotrichum somersetense]|nr:hypothetical protein LZ31DRAFT_167855 [Colletotrichum somersetense]